MRDGFWHSPDMASSPRVRRTTGLGISISVIAAVVTTFTPASGARVTFNHDIAPIIYQNCSPCHRPGEAAPFALLSYTDVT
jgi:hypothetical protein